MKIDGSGGKKGEKGMVEKFFGVSVVWSDLVGMNAEKGLKSIDGWMGGCEGLWNSNAGTVSDK